MDELTHAQLLDIARSLEPWATWLAPGGCLESAHLELTELMRFAIAADRAARPQSPDLSTVVPGEVDLFVVRHYTDDERPSIKGNGFDGLEIGEDRQEAEEFIAWINARLHPGAI